ncbi:MAG TPA: hypothetical protein VFU90_14930 [Candidatus Tumulicola sp.]|nr:hypothetical protein [Candidatus Tumulicola sp.]
MKLLPVVLTAALLAPGAAAAQQPQTGGSKILVTECNPHEHTAAEAHPWIDPYGNPHYTTTNFPAWDAFLTIGYKNQAPSAATEVDFGLTLRGSLVAVAKDVGTFSPGVAIDHEFVVSREIFPLDGMPYCTVLRVKYADGTVWQNPSPPEP